MRTHCKTAHEKVRAHACPSCEGVAFGTKSSLKTHIKTVHEKRRDHACGYAYKLTCTARGDVAFGTASHLHVSAVHPKIKRSRGAK